MVLRQIPRLFPIILQHYNLKVDFIPTFNPLYRSCENVKIFIWYLKEGVWGLSSCIIKAGAGVTHWEKSYGGSVKMQREPMLCLGCKVLIEFIDSCNINPCLPWQLSGVSFKISHAPVVGSQGTISVIVIPL